MSLERFTTAEFDIQLIPAGDSFRVAAAGLARGLGPLPPPRRLERRTPCLIVIA